MKTFELTPINGRKSFNSKAKVINVGNIYKLQSYNTIVAEFNQSSNEMAVFGWYSATTAIHINAFLDVYGFDTCTKKELENYNN